MGKLYLVATPIGNLEDLSLRAAKTLLKVTAIACEDTRKTGFLLSRIPEVFPLLELPAQKPQLIPFFEGNEEQATGRIKERLAAGEEVALVSDAGTPLISDPGFKLVRDCSREGVAVEAMPGPVAAVTALILSGLPTDRWLFIGFLPKKAGKREKIFAEIKKLADVTVILYESPFRLAKTLTDLAGVFGDLEAVTARELTKIHEEILRGSFSSLKDRFEKKAPKGEVVLIFRKTV